MNTAPKWLVYGYIVLFACLPWSIDLDLGGWNMMLPSEPLLGALSVGLAVSFWIHRGAFYQTFSQSTFLIIGACYLFWVAITAAFSSMPLVSWKNGLVETTHAWVFALGIFMWPDLWRKAIPWFIGSMTVVAIYTMIHHAGYHFRADQAILAPMPFFPDHTMWAAALVILLGILLSENPWTQAQKIAFGVLSLALVLSTCRAAWVTVLLVGAVWGLVSLDKTRRALLLLVLLIGGLWGANRMLPSLAQDVSALERINRWHCAWRMVAEKPLFGFGPGTFRFQYLPFQKPEEMTRISLREPIARRGPDNYGRGGGAHSEYLRVLAESGWPGLLLWLVLLGVVLWPAVRRLLYQSSTPKPRLQDWALLLALLSFLFHAWVNEFLHDGRIAALVWGGMAMLARRTSAVDSTVPE